MRLGRLGRALQGWRRRRLDPDRGRGPGPQPVLAEVRDLLAAVVASSSDAIMTKTLDGVITSWNAAAERILGYTASEIIGRPVGILIPHDRRDEEQEIRARVARGERVEHLETVRLSRAGRPLEVFLTVSPIRDLRGQIVGASSVARDISDRKRVEAALRESEERFRALVMNAPAAIFIKDLDGRYRVANTLARAALGRTEGVEGMTDDELLPADVADLLRRHDLEVLARGSAIEQEELVRRPGFERSYLSVKFPVPGASGEPSGVGGVAIDVTDRLRAEAARRESDERFRTLADHIAQLAWMADENGGIFWYNQRWFDYTGTTLEEMQGWGWTKLQHPDHVDRVLARVRHSRNAGDTWEDTFPLRGRDGTYRWFLTRAVPIRGPEGGVLRWFGTNTDVTALREAEEALREADRRKDLFLATLAHEIRNPLAPLRHAVDVVRAGAADSDTQRRMRDMMDRQLAQLERLVDDLIDVSRITRDRLELRKETLELGAFIAQVAESAQALAASFQHELEVLPPTGSVPFVADPVRLAQVLGNLLENACKYTPTGGRISLAAEREADEVVFSVRDTGIGIAPELVPRAFEMFTQLGDPAYRVPGGLGVGLTLVRRLVELHGGTVTARSEPGECGSEFEVRLPIEHSESRPPAAPRRRGGGSLRRILLVDDNEDAAESLAMLLRHAGHEVHVAGDGEAGLEAAAALRPDAVLLDIGLPGISGLDVARRLRAQPWGEALLLVALTGWGQAEDRQRSREAGFDEHFVKPVGRAELMSLLEAGRRG